jgi:hypothetical protein
MSSPKQTSTAVTAMSASLGRMKRSGTPKIARSTFSPAPGPLPRPSRAARLRRASLAEPPNR